MVLMVNNLTGFGAGGGVAEFSYITSSAINVTQTTFNFGILSLGNPDGNRHIVVAVTNDASGAVVAPVSVTVDGISATKLVQVLGTGASSSIWIAAATANLTGNVTFVSGTTELCAAVHIYRLVNYNPTAFATATATTGNPVSTTINVAANGVVIAGVLVDAGAPGTNLWSNLTENYDVAIGGSAGATAASAVFSTAVTGQSISNNNSGGAAAQYLTAVSLQPR